MTKQNKLAPNNSTKCPYLDGKGVSSANSGVVPTLNNVDIKDYEVVKYCLKCELPECIVKEKEDATMEKRKKVLEEKTLCCLECGAEETFIFKDGQLGKTRKWEQVGDEVFHLAKWTCGKAKVIGGQ